MANKSQYGASKTPVVVPGTGPKPKGMPTNPQGGSKAMTPGKKTIARGRKKST